MSHKRKERNSISSKFKPESLELPLRNGFRRALIKRDNDSIVSIYYITPNDTYLKNISEVCAWIKKEKKQNLFDSHNFNFVTRKFTSHEREFILDYAMLPDNLKHDVIEKKRSVAPIIVTVHSDDTFSIKREPYSNEIESNLSIETNIENAAVKTVSNDGNVEECITSDPFVSPTQNDNVIPIKSEISVDPIVTPTQNDNVIPIKSENSVEVPNSETSDTIHAEEDPSQDYQIKTESVEMDDTIDTDDPLPIKPESVIEEESFIPIKRMKLDDTSIDSDDNSMTLSIDSTDKGNCTNSVVLKPRLPYEYPMATVNTNNLVEQGTHCHIDFIQEHFNGKADINVVKSMKGYCGNHCAFDFKGCPRVAFECDICLILWHNDCSGHRWITAGPLHLMVCDNCFILQQYLNVDLPNIFCDINSLLQSEFTSETTINASSIAIPLKLEAILKLCKFQWLIENMKKPNNVVREKAPKKAIPRIVSREFPRDCKYFIKIFIKQDMIVNNHMKEDCVRLKYTVSEIDIMSKLFADPRCEMMINDQKYTVIISKIIVKFAELLIPVSGRISRPEFSVFYTYEYGQSSHVDYIQRCDNLKTLMVNVLKQSLKSIPVRHEVNSILYNQLVEPKPQQFNQNVVSRISTGPVANKITVIPSNCIKVSLPCNNKSIQSISSQNLPKNIIPISREQIRKFSNVIKTRKRKQEFSGQNFPLMSGKSSSIQYYHLVDLPFSILERILICKNLSTVDKLNCRLANRVLKCVVDGGSVWNTVVINPGLVTGLQTMFDFFSQRNVKHLTFNIDFQESFGIDFFTSFINRLKLFPESFHLEKISIKLSGMSSSSSKFTVTVQEIISSTKSLKILSISSAMPTSIGLGRANNTITSHSLETLKLKNLDNISDILRTNPEATPQLRTLHSGDWSNTFSIDLPSLVHVTRLSLDFSEFINFSEVTSFSDLVNLEHLSISRPRINAALIDLLSQISTVRSLKYFHLDTEVVTKDQTSSAIDFGRNFPPQIPRIEWIIFLNSFVIQSKTEFEKKVVETIPDNVRVRIKDL